jgi:hypothetical protein
MLFTGIKSTPRSIGSVQFELLMDVDSLEQGLALIAYGIGQDFTPEKATPWFDEGRNLRDQLPWRARTREYEQRPSCKVEADWFRVMAKKLRSAAEVGSETDSFLVTFKDSLLRFDLPILMVAVPAIGSNWETRYRGRLIDLRHLPKRTPAGGVEVSIWDSRIQIGRLALPVHDAQAPGSSLSGNHAEVSGDGQ